LSENGGGHCTELPGVGCPLVLVVRGWVGVPFS
jgi:hypothetical protein